MIFFQVSIGTYPECFSEQCAGMCIRNYIMYIYIHIYLLRIYIYTFIYVFMYVCMYVCMDVLYCNVMKCNVM